MNRPRRNCFDGTLRNARTNPYKKVHAVICMAVGMAANPQEAHQVGRHRDRPIYEK